MIVLAGCIIRDAQGAILLLHRNVPGRVRWELPGGKVDVGETTEEAARREVLEELGVTLTDVTWFGAESFCEGEREFSYQWFTAQIAAGTPTPREVIFDEARYIPVSELETLSLSPNMRQLLSHLRTLDA